MESAPLTEKQETIENIKAKVRALQKNPVPSQYTPGSQEPGSSVKIGDRVYKVGLGGNVIRITEKPLSKKALHRETVAANKAKLNPNLTRRLEREDRLNKIKMFNKVQKDLEREMTREKPQHPKVPLVKPPTTQPRNEELPSDIYLELKKLREKTKAAKEKKKKARKLASLMRKLNRKNK